MKGLLNDCRSRHAYRLGLAGCVLAYILCIASPASPQANPVTVGIPTTTAPNYSWIRSVQTLGNGNTAVRYIAANSVSAPAGSTVYAVGTRSAVAGQTALLRSPKAAAAIRTICAERRACLIALGAAGALGTLGVLAQLGSDGLPEEPLLDSNGIPVNMINYPQASFSPGPPPELAKNTEGNGVGATSISYDDFVEAGHWNWSGRWDSSTQTYGPQEYTIVLEGEYEIPDPILDGSTWRHYGWNDSCAEFVKYAGGYVYPDAWCTPATRIQCDQGEPCYPSTSSPNAATSELELGNIIMNPSITTITNDQARRVMEQTNFQPAQLGVDAQGRAIIESVWEFGSVAASDYATQSEILSNGLDAWGATDAEGNVIGNPQTGWDPATGGNVSDPQTAPETAPEPDPATDPNTGDGNTPNYPEPPYDVSIINIDDGIPDGIGADVPEEQIDIPSYFDYGARWLPTSCPSPQTIDIGVAQIPFDFQATCTGLDFMSYLLVASALIGSLNIVMRSAFA